MEQSGQIGIGRLIAWRLENSREKKRKVQEGRGPKRNQLRESNAKVAEGRGRLKKTEGL
jgi:hypothetical protein